MAQSGVSAFQISLGVNGYPMSTKKIISLLVGLVLVMSLSGTAFAEDEAPEGGSLLDDAGPLGEGSLFGDMGTFDVGDLFDGGLTFGDGSLFPDGGFGDFIAGDPNTTGGENADDGEKTVDPEAVERGLAALQATGWADVLVLPKEESYLSEWKTGYARKAFHAPSLRVERISQLHTGRWTMPSLYEGTEATVVAEENGMSCMIYRGVDNNLYAGWIQSIRLLDEFPGKQYTVGTAPEGDYSLRDDLTVSWSRKSWLDSPQNYSALSEEVPNCIGFTLEYQIVAENTPYWQSILGPRRIYVKSGEDWTEVGEFEYPELGAVKIQVWLPEPMDINAVGTIAQCGQPNIFYFRQTATDFAVLPD